MGQFNGQVTWRTLGDVKAAGFLSILSRSVDQEDEFGVTGVLEVDAVTEAIKVHFNQLELSFRDVNDPDQTIKIVGEIVFRSP